MTVLEENRSASQYRECRRITGKLYKGDVRSNEKQPSGRTMKQHLKGKAASCKYHRALLALGNEKRLMDRRKEEKSQAWSLLNVAVCGWNQGGVRDVEGRTPLPCLWKPPVFDGGSRWQHQGCQEYVRRSFQILKGHASTHSMLHQRRWQLVIYVYFG